MRKPTLYSRSDAARRPSTEGSWSDAVAQAPRPQRRRRTLAGVVRHPAVLWGALCLLALQSALLGWQQMRPAPAALTQKQIDDAVLHTLSTRQLPSRQARAAEAIRPSVVRVVSYTKNRKGQREESGVGTGLVIQDKGLVLTNLHVVQGAGSLELVFADGSPSQALVVGMQPQHDLAVLQALTVPDDLKAATLRASTDLVPGQEVIAVGFPFGIGPSVSAGVVSGLGRSFQSPEGEQEVENLIQFDAAANPGNSGGPLLTLDGEVVGIVTGILNPTNHRTFVGIGFAVPIESAASAAGLPPF